MAEAIPGGFEDLGKVLLHSALVGLAAGAVALVFLGGLELVERVCLQKLAGYTPLRAQGEPLLAQAATSTFRPWVLLILPALGALGSGLLTHAVPETRGGGGDAMIRAYHQGGGLARRRVIWVKALASILTLGTGGAGGREGPTMQIGGALGSAVARALSVSPRERRILLVAGVAAGISAVFKTPLGAALLAVEVLFRDDFETDALVPAVLASVMAYSVVIGVSGESILFARAPRYPFAPSHLPLYALLALFICILANIFLFVLRRVESATERMPVPGWARPAVGGLALGILAAPAIWLVGESVHAPGRGSASLAAGTARRSSPSRARRGSRRAGAASRSCSCSARASSPPRSPSAPAAARGTSRPRARWAPSSAAPSVQRYVGRYARPVLDSEYCLARWQLFWLVSSQLLITAEPCVTSSISRER